MIAEVGAGICLPGEKKYQVRICINDYSVTTDALKEVKAGYCRWSRRFEQVLFKTSYSSVEEMERIYVYLMDGDYPVCYWQGDVSEFIDPNPQYKWIPLRADLSVGKVTDQWKAGML